MRDLKAAVRNPLNELLTTASSYNSRQDRHWYYFVALAGLLNKLSSHYIVFSGRGGHLGLHPHRVSPHSDPQIKVILCQNEAMGGIYVLT